MCQKSWNEDMGESTSSSFWSLFSLSFVEFNAGMARQSVRAVFICHAGRRAWSEAPYLQF